MDTSQLGGVYTRALEKLDIRSMRNDIQEPRLILIELS